MMMFWWRKCRLLLMMLYFALLLIIIILNNCSHDFLFSCFFQIKLKTKHNISSVIEDVVVTRRPIEVWFVKWNDPRLDMLPSFKTASCAFYCDTFLILEVIEGGQWTRGGHLSVVFNRMHFWDVSFISCRRRQWMISIVVEYLSLREERELHKRCKRVWCSFFFFVGDPWLSLLSCFSLWFLFKFLFHTIQESFRKSKEEEEDEMSWRTCLKRENGIVWRKGFVIFCRLLPHLLR